MLLFVVSFALFLLHVQAFDECPCGISTINPGYFFGWSAEYCNGRDKNSRRNVYCQTAVFKEFKLQRWGKDDWNVGQMVYQTTEPLHSEIQFSNPNLNWLNVAREKRQSYHTYGSDFCQNNMGDKQQVCFHIEQEPKMGSDLRDKMRYQYVDGSAYQFNGMFDRSKMENHRYEYRPGSITVICSKNRGFFSGRDIEDFVQQNGCKSLDLKADLFAQLALFNGRSIYRRKKRSTISPYFHIEREIFDGDWDQKREKWSFGPK